MSDTIDETKPEPITYLKLEIRKSKRSWIATYQIGLTPRYHYGTTPVAALMRAIAELHDNNKL